VGLNKTTLLGQNGGNEPTLLLKERPMSYNTLWQVPDDLWNEIEPLLPPAKALGTVGNPALPQRKVLNGILYVLRTGCQWKSLRTEWFGASSSVHTYFQTWQQVGVWQKVFERVLRYYDKTQHIQWQWQAIDSKSVAAPLGGEKTGKNPTDRGKLGSKRHLLTDGRGAPLAVVVSGANVNEVTCTLDVLDALVVERPQRTYRVHHLCGDKGYDSDALRQAVTERQYQVHFGRRWPKVTQVPPSRRDPARRWVIERTLSWQNDFRSLRTRWAKKADNWLALIHFACALVLWQMCATL
jgi:putative transposase